MTRYINTPNIRYLDKEIKARWGQFQWLITKPEEYNILTYKINTQSAGEPRRIAQVLYGDHNLYWVLVSFNAKWYNDSGAKNVFGWPAAGQIIYYPRFSVFSASIS